MLVLQNVSDSAVSLADVGPWFNSPGNVMTLAAGATAVSDSSLQQVVATDGAEMLSAYQSTPPTINGHVLNAGIYGPGNPVSGSYLAAGLQASAGDSSLSVSYDSATDQIAFVNSSAQAVSVTNGSMNLGLPSVIAPATEGDGSATSQSVANAFQNSAALDSGFAVVPGSAPADALQAANGIAWNDLPGGPDDGDRLWVTQSGVTFPVSGRFFNPSGANVEVFASGDGTAPPHVVFAVSPSGAMTVTNAFGAAVELSGNLVSALGFSSSGSANVSLAAGQTVTGYTQAHLEASGHANAITLFDSAGGLLPDQLYGAQVDEGVGLQTLAETIQGDIGNADVSVSYDGATGQMVLRNSGSSAVNLNFGNPSLNLPSSIPGFAQGWPKSLSGDDLVINGKSIIGTFQNAAQVAAAVNNHVPGVQATVSNGTLQLSGGYLDVTGSVAGDVQGGFGFHTGVIAPTSTPLGAISVATQRDADLALQKIDAAMQTVTSAQGQLGADTQRLRSVADNLTGSVQQQSSARSVVQDANIPQVSERMTQEQVLQAARIASLKSSTALEQMFVHLLP